VASSPRIFILSPPAIIFIQVRDLKHKDCKVWRLCRAVPFLLSLVESFFIILCIKQIFQIMVQTSSIKNQLYKWVTQRCLIVVQQPATKKLT